MNKKQILVLIACMLGAFAVIAALFKNSPLKNEIRRQTFIRNFDSNIYLTKKKVLDLKVNSFYFVGSTKHALYLGNWTAPFHLVEVTLPDLDTTHMDIRPLGDSIPGDYQVFRMKVDSPYFYLTHRTLPGIYKGTLGEKISSNFATVNAPYFAAATPISPSSIALRYVNSDTKEYDLAKFSTNSPYFKGKPNLLEKQVDGLFCKDGTLHYEKASNRLIYLYAYRNEYFVMDTSLNLINRYHTIDTFRHANIKVAAIGPTNYRTLASPPARTNLLNCVDSSYLYVQSPLLAANEDRLTFQKGTVIDAYNFNNGSYEFSFYLNRLADHGPSDMIVMGDFAAAIYDHYLYLYTFNKPKH